MSNDHRQIQRLQERIRELERLSEPPAFQQQLVTWQSQNKWTAAAAEEFTQIAEILEQVIKEVQEDGS
jgi:cellulose biosynthesis protein BcsQ